MHTTVLTQTGPMATTVTHKYAVGDTIRHTLNESVVDHVVASVTGTFYNYVGGGFDYIEILDESDAHSLLPPHKYAPGDIISGEYASGLKMHETITGVSWFNPRNGERLAKLAYTYESGGFDDAHEIDATETIGIHVPDVYEEILAERGRQDVKFGRQNHPWGLDIPGVSSPSRLWIDHPATSAAHARGRVDAFAQGQGGAVLGFCDILMEEVYEALEADTIEHAREELVQVAAVAVAAIESIDRNGR